jgi:thioredoxin-like negative regulator of GroEL
MPPDDRRPRPTSSPRSSRRTRERARPLQPRLGALRGGRFADAEPHFAKALALKGDWVMAYILRARCLIRLGRIDEARPLLATGRRHSLAQHHEAPVEEIDEILAELG